MTQENINDKLIEVWHKIEEKNRQLYRIKYKMEKLADHAADIEETIHMLSDLLNKLQDIKNNTVPEGETIH